MHTFKYNNDGDWILNELVEGEAELIQNLKHLLKTRVGEWLFDLQHGFRRDVIEQKLPNKKRIIQAIHDCLYQEPRVMEVISVEYDFNKIKRLLTIDFKVKTRDGNVIGGGIDVNTRRI